MVRRKHDACSLSLSHFFSLVPSGPPQNVVARATDATTLRISWAPPVAERVNGLIQRYSLSITELETGTSEQFSTREESIAINDRHPYYRYGYVVAAVTTGQGPYSVATLIRMPEAGRYIGQGFVERWGCPWTPLPPDV